MEKIDYQSAGVDVTRGYEAVEKMRSHLERTKTPGVLGGIGGFGGMFELPAGYENPVLVSGTDGVGTKLQVAFMAQKHDTVGVDCVAMCVNDIVCLGAKPLFFLDYIGTGILEPQQVADIVKGISDGCVESGCALVGGESAEMPGFYKKGEYDLAGFSVGVVEKDKIIDGKNISAGNVLIGISSSGIHSNGFSLVRKLVFDAKGFKIDDVIPETGKTVKDELLVPTKLYVKLILELLDNYKINGISHITGGGWIENIPRMLNANLKAVVTNKTHEVQPIFKAMQAWGNLEDEDMYNTFNMGIGMVVAVDEADADKVLEQINTTDKAYIIGRVEERGDGERAIEFV